jgi:hypothetical protein
VERESSKKIIQNYWVFGLFASSGILETRNQDVSETDQFPKRCVL